MLMMLTANGCKFGHLTKRGRLIQMQEWIAMGFSMADVVSLS